MTKNSVADDVFDISSLDSVDESRMTVAVNGKLTDWVWVFAGPGHPQTVEQSDRISKERLHREHQQEQARVNGRKWKAPDETADEVLDRNVRIVAERLLDWYRADSSGRRTERPILLNGEPYPFSRENAVALLKDRRKGALLIQALEFLGDEAAFSKRSETV